MTQKTQATSNTIQKGSMALLIFVVLFLSFLTFPVSRMINIDSSWAMVLSFAVKQNWQAGVDYIFTYGPLGYFSLKNLLVYNADLFYETVLWLIVFNGLFSIAFLVRWYQLHDWIEKSLFLFLSAIVMTSVSFFNDSLYSLAIVCLTILMIHPPTFLNAKERYFPVLGLALLSLAILSLTKFSTLILVMLCIISIVIVFWHRYSFFKATIILIIFMIMFIGAWVVLCKQSLLNIPAYFINSLDMARSYSEAMSLEPKMTLVWLALSGMGVTSILVIFNCLIQPREFSKFVSGGIILLSLFLSWKAGFVRADFFHVTTFFCFATIVPFLIVRSQNMGLKRSLIFSGLLFSSVFIALSGAFYTTWMTSQSSANHLLSTWQKKFINNATTLLSLSQVKGSYDLITLNLKQKYAYPTIQAKVGNATVDIFPPEQRIVLLNAFNYHPRPIFQGYAAYTEFLLEINSHFYTNPSKAPEYILFNLTAIDRRVPTMEDSQALTAILRDYKPILFEKGLLLLKRTLGEKGIITNDVKPLFTKEIPLSHSVNVQPFSDKTLFLSLEIRKNWLGRLVSLLYQQPPLFLEVKTTDGRTFIFRIVPSISQADFLINPLLLGQRDLLKWYKGKPLMQVASLRVVAKSEWALSLFQPQMHITVKKDEGSNPPFGVHPKENY
jgi:hypothetical protein